eukprot:Nk52_evm4s442 gene=Nk52_evmTU4s442
MGNSLSPRLESAKKTGVFAFPGEKLEKIPEDVFELGAKVRSINLATNKLTKIPSLIANFSNLKSLDLENNRIDRVCDEIGGLLKLETLKLGNNRISVFPATVCSLKKLKVLSLNDNSLSTFPEGVLFLEKLTALYLSRNKITCIPNAVVNMKALIELDIGNNRVSSLPTGSFEKLPKFKVLRLNMNQLTLESIPSSIFSDSAISLIDLEGNPINEKELRLAPGYDKQSLRFALLVQNVSGMGPFFHSLWIPLKHKPD